MASNTTQPCGIVGIGYDKSFVQNLEGSAPRLAGCFGLVDSAAIWALIENDPATNLIIYGYIHHRANNYDHGEKIKAVIKNTVVEWSQDPNVLPVLLAPAAPRAGVLGVKENQLPELTVLWFVVQLMKAKGPQLFPRSSLAADPPVLNPYDVLHGWKLLAFAWKQIQGGKKAKIKPQVNPALKPIYHQPNHPDTDVGPGRERPNSPRPDLTAADLFGGDPDEANRFIAARERVHRGDITALANYDIVSDSFERLFRSDPTRQKPTNARAPMTNAERELLCTHMMGMDDFESKLILHEPANTTVGDSDTQVFLNRLAAASTATEMITLTADEAGMGPEQPREAAVGNTQGRMTLSADPPSYHDACAELALDPANPVLMVPSNLPQPATTLKKWQVSGACWMLRQEASPVAAGILADACGTGKTTTAVTTMWYASVRAGRDPAHTHRPTLILCPSALIDTWLGELTARFGDAFTILVFHGHSAHTSNYTRKSLTVDTLADLEAHLQRLDDRDVKTSRTLVLSSYSTWAARTLTEVRGVEGKGKARQVDGADSDDDNPPDENTLAIEQLALLQEAAETANDGDPDEAADFGPGRKGRPAKQYDSLASGWFGRVVCDEGHAAKTIRTRVHQSVRLLEAPHVWFLTATPLYNRAFDMCGYLAILSSNLRGLDDTNDPDFDWFAQYKHFAEMDHLPNPPPYNLLLPKAFVSLFVRGHLAPREAYWALPVIMRMVCLRRDMGDPVDVSDSTALIGDEIPPMRIMSVDLRHPPRVLEDHHHRFTQLLSEMKRSGGPDKEAHHAGAPGGDSQGHLDWRVMRLLCHLSFSPLLDDYYRAADEESDTMAAAIAKAVDRGDRGFADFWWRTTPGVRNMMPVTRLGVAHYLSADCVKLRYLLRIFQQEGVWRQPAGDQPRFLVFTHWPMVMWVAEMFLDAISIPYVTIRAQMGEAARREAAAEFTNSQSSCRVLLTSYQCGAHGLNLHNECSRVILLEPPLNLNTLFQAVGRVHRLGQRSSQKVWSIFQEHTISRWLECNNMLKALPQFSAQLHDLLKPMVMAARANDDGEDAAAADEAEAEIIQRAASDCLRRMLGQPASRLSVEDLDDLGLPQRDLDRMRARMTPRGRKRERGRQISPSEAHARRKRTKGTASKYKSTEYVVSDSENGSATEEESSSSEPEADDSGLDSGRDSPGPGNRGHGPGSPRDDDEADDDNGNGGGHGGSGYRADPTPEQSAAARAILQEVYQSAQDAAIAELQQSDPTRARQLARLQRFIGGNDLTTPPPSQQGVIQASPVVAVDVSQQSSPLSSAPLTAPPSPPEKPMSPKGKKRAPVANNILRRSKRPRRNVHYKV